jgi:hypothetical protein
MGGVGFWLGSEGPHPAGAVEAEGAGPASFQGRSAATRADAGRARVAARLCPSASSPKSGSDDRGPAREPAVLRLELRRRIGLPRDERDLVPEHGERERLTRPRIKASCATLILCPMRLWSSTIICRTI